MVRTLYRNLLRQARRADADVILRHQISKQPVDVLQVASAGLGRSCRAINVQVNGQRGRIPRLHAIYDRDVAPADFAAAATATPATPRPRKSGCRPSVQTRAARTTTTC